MSLLDDVSIVVTPNGYKAGELYAVVPVPTEGAELVTNGDFATDLSGWDNSGSGTSVWDSGRAKLTTTGTGYIKPISAITTVVGLRYEFLVTLTGTGNTANVRAGTSSLGFDLFNSGWGVTDGSHIYYFVATTTTTYIAVGNGSAGVSYIDNVSVKELTSADMDVTRATAGTRVDENGLVNYAEIIGGEEVTDGNFPLPNTNWILGGSGSNIPTIGTNDVAINSVDGNSFIQQSGILTSGKYYKITYDVISASATSNVLKLASSFGLGSIPTSVGTQIVYGTAITSTLYIERYTNGVNATITNVSVKEVTRDNVPRIDYTGGGCPHILAEPQRTNDIPYSENFSLWTQYGSPTIVQNIISPDGTLNGTQVTRGSNQTPLRYSNVTTLNQEYTYSIYAKKGSVDVMILDIGDETNASFTLTDEWQRFTVTSTPTTYTHIDLSLGTSVSGDYIYIYGASLEQGSYPTSYIPTSGSTVTRNQDTFTRDGIGSLINSTEGVLFIEIAFSDAGRLAILNSDASDDQVVLGFSGTVFCRIRENGANVVTQFVSSANQLNTYYKIAVKYKSGSSAIWVDGNETVFAGTFTLNDLSKILFISEGSRTYGKVKQLQVYTTALTDEQLLQLTGESGTDFYESYAEMAAALTYTIQ